EMHRMAHTRHAGCQRALEFPGLPCSPGRPDPANISLARFAPNRCAGLVRCDDDDEAQPVPRRRRASGSVCGLDNSCRCLLAPDRATLTNCAAPLTPPWSDHNPGNGLPGRTGPAWTWTD